MPIRQDTSNRLLPFKQLTDEIIKLRKRQTQSLSSLTNLLKAGGDE